MLELGPLLPYSHGAEGTVVVKNPCEFPIEFYSLEFDQQYLAEEQVRGKVWSTRACSCSFTALQHSQACAREMEAVPRAKPGGILGLASSASGLWKGLDSPCCWEEEMRGKIGWLGSLFIDRGQETHPVCGFSSLHAQILRMLKDYDCHNTLLLPLRTPGEKLPPEVLEYYQDQIRLQDEQAKSKTGEPAGQDNGEGLALAVLGVDTAGSPAHLP